MIVNFVAKVISADLNFVSRVVKFVTYAVMEIILKANVRQVTKTETRL